MHTTDLQCHLYGSYPFFRKFVGFRTEYVNFRRGIYLSNSECMATDTLLYKSNTSNFVLNYLSTLLGIILNSKERQMAWFDSFYVSSANFNMKRSE